MPALVLPCPSVRRLPTGDQPELWGAILPAAWSFMLAARVRELGTARTTLHLAHEAEVVRSLGSRWRAR